MNYFPAGYELFACWIRAICFAGASVDVGSVAKLFSRRRPVKSATTEETKMKRMTAFTALSVAIIVGSVSGAMAAAKKHTDAHLAYGSADGGKTLVDPRDAYWAKRKSGGDMTWCDADEKCNGGADWVQAVSTGKLKY